jgi:hypothetical protein
MPYLDHIRSLQKRMLGDQEFKGLCKKYKIPWDPDRGYEPRWFAGPEVSPPRFVIVMAEPAPISKTEENHLLPAVDAVNWLDGYNFKMQEHYWRLNVKALFREIWPEETSMMMNRHVGGTCAFWMSLPHGKTTLAIPRELEAFFIEKYFLEVLALCAKSELIAAGSKASARLSRYAIPHHKCWAFTRPGCNRTEAQTSWRLLGQSLRALHGGTSKASAVSGNGAATFA